MALTSDALSRISLEPFHLTPHSTAAGGILARQYLAIALALFVVLGLAGCLEPPAGEGTLTPTSLASLASATSTASPTQTDTPSPTSTLVATSTPAPTHTYTPSPTSTSVATSTPSPTHTYTPSPTSTSVATSTATLSPSPSRTSSPAPTATRVASSTPTPTASPTRIRIASATPTRTEATATHLPLSPSPTVSATVVKVPTTTPAVALTATATVSESPTRAGTAPARATRAATSTVAPTRSPVESLQRPSRRAIAVMISNDPEALPQSGLLEADIVYEAPAEFNLTRLLPIFLTDSPEKVGPIRSTRSYFVGLAAEYGGGLAHCLDVPSVPPIFEDTDAFSLDGCRGLAAEAFFRDDGRQAPWNLYVDVSLLERHVPDYGYWGPMALRSRLAGGSRISEAVLTFVKGHQVEWTYRSGRYYRRQNGRRHMDSGGRQLAADVVVVQMVVTRDTSFFGEAGYHEVDVVDEGDGYILAGGRMMELRWSRQRLDGITKWTSLAGRPVHIPRGQVWVEIMPIGSEVIFREPKRPYSPLDPSIVSLSFRINRDLRLAALLR